MKRKKLREPFIPAWDDTIQSYATSWARRNVSRLGVLYDVVDLEQEAYFVFLRCEARFDRSRITGGADRHQRAFIALFRLALDRRGINLGKRAGRKTSSLDLPLAHHSEDLLVVELADSAPRGLRNYLNGAKRTRAGLKEEVERWIFGGKSESSSPAIV